MPPRWLKWLQCMAEEFLSRCEKKLIFASSPIAGAQYHWTAEHAPLKYRAFLSYFQGWITILGWMAALASVASLLAAMIQAVALFNNPNYDATRWQATLIMIGFAALATLGNTLGKKFLPIFETLAGFLHVYVAHPIYYTRI